MVVHIDDELIFTPDGNRMWIAVTDKGKISVNVLADVTKIFHIREERFDDLFDALQYLQDLTGQRPLFGIDERTANVKTNN
mgnify:CR=1 FL=1